MDHYEDKNDQNDTKNYMPNYMPLSKYPKGRNGILTMVTYIKDNGKLPKGMFPKRTLYRYVQKARKDAIIRYIGFGTWEVTDTGISILENVATLFDPNLGSPLRVGQNGIYPKESFSPENNGGIRGHGYQWRLGVVAQDWRVLALNGGVQSKDRRSLYDLKAVRINYGGFRFDFFKRAVNIYPEAVEGFFGVSALDCDRQARSSLLAAIKGLQGLGFRLMINGQFDLRVVKAGEFAHVNNSLARDFVSRGKRLTCVADDGKAWLKIDNSLNVPELETVHPRDAQVDMDDKVKLFFDDLKRNPFTGSELLGMFAVQQGQNKVFSDGMISMSQAVTVLAEVVGKMRG